MGNNHDINRRDLLKTLVALPILGVLPTEALAAKFVECSSPYVMVNFGNYGVGIPVEDIENNKWDEICLLLSQRLSEYIKSNQNGDTFNGCAEVIIRYNEKSVVVKSHEIYMPDSNNCYNGVELIVFREDILNGIKNILGTEPNV